MKKSGLKQIENQVIDFFQYNEYSLKEELLLVNELILIELLNPDNYYEYSGSKGFYSYYDLNNVEFFVRLAYQPVDDPYFELKTGWIDENGKPKYEPSIPPISPNSSAIDWDKRSNTLAKIYRDELLPFFEKQTLSDTICIIPISISRIKFAERMVDKFTNKQKFDIIKLDKRIRIVKK